MKSDRLKKLEAELSDLEQWMKLGLVPNKELERHKEEIHSLRGKIEEEKERLQFLKESGDMEEYAAPRRNPAKAVYPDTPSMTDMEIGETTEAGFDVEQESSTETQEETTHVGEEAAAEDEEFIDDEDDPFSDRNRWKRGGIIDPEANDW
ncbi:MAG: hypothetical protein ACKVOH_03145 [Chlamydiales bacterium]